MAATNIRGDDILALIRSVNARLRTSLALAEEGLDAAAAPVLKSAFYDSLRVLFLIDGRTPPKSEQTLLGTAEEYYNTSFAFRQEGVLESVRWCTEVADSPGDFSEVERHNLTVALRACQSFVQSLEAYCRRKPMKVSLLCKYKNKLFLGAVPLGLAILYFLFVSSPFEPGLRRQNFADSKFSKAIGFIQAPRVHFRSPGATASQRIRSSMFVGQIFFTVAGKQALLIETAGRVRLWIDGQLVFRLSEDTEMMEHVAYAEIKRGWHDILIEYSEIDTAGGLSLKWITPLGKKEVVPSRYLRSIGQ